MSSSASSKIGLLPFSSAMAITLIGMCFVSGCSTLGLQSDKKTTVNNEQTQESTAEKGAEFPKDDPRFYLMEAAKISEQDGNPLEAMQIYKKILELHPDYRPATLGFSRTGREAGQSKLVLSYLYQLLGQNSNDSDWVAETAKAHYALSQYDTALKQVDSAIKLVDNKWEYYSLRGAICDKLNRFEDSQMAYQKALSLSKDNPKVLNNYAMSRFLVKDLKSAEDYALQGTQSKQATLQNYQTYAMILLKQGRDKEAQDFLNTNLNKKQAEIMMRYLKNQTASPVLWGRTNPS